MIEDSKWVKSVVSNAPKKGWKITWHDDKYDNIFDESWLKILDQAQKGQRMIHFTKEQNQSGYWNIKTLELANLEAQPQPAPEYPKDEVAPKDSPPVSKDDAIAKHVWYKELGECLRSGEIDKTKPQGRLLRNAYYAEMFRVLGLKFDKEEQ